MKVISIMNEKGGIGKTVTATSIAWILADRGYNVLLLDGDQQGNASKLYHSIEMSKQNNLSEILEAELDNKLSDEIIQRGINRLTLYNKLSKVNQEGSVDVIPSNGYLTSTNIKIAISEKANQIFLLKNMIEKLNKIDFYNDYDYIVCDCGLILDMTVLNILMVTDLLIAPIKLGGFEADAINDLKTQVKNLEGFNPNIKIKGLLTMKQKNKATEQVEEFLNDNKEYDMFETTIMRSIIVEKSTAAFVPLPAFSKNSKVVRQYKSLVNEILEVL